MLISSVNGVTKKRLTISHINPTRMPLIQHYLKQFFQIKNNNQIDFSSTHFEIKPLTLITTQSEYFHGIKIYFSSRLL